MCIALPEEGRGYLARLNEGHLSKFGARAAAWLADNLEDPASNLPRDDAELAGLIAELVIVANDEPASAESMELNYMLLEQGRLEAEIAAAGRRRGSRAPGRAQPRAGGARRADRPGRAGRELTGKFSGPIRGSSIGRALGC